MRTLSFALLLACAGLAQAGHTRPGYVDGAQSIDGRFVVTAKFDASQKQWRFLWHDKKEGKSLTGALVGVPPCQQGHFDVAYVHLFVAPDGETFAAFNAASWAGFNRDLGKVPEPTSPSYKEYAGFKDRVVVYRKSGEIVRRLGINDILKGDEWAHVHHVQGNLYWLGESPDYPAKSTGEPPRCGYRYYRISPDYTTLELSLRPDREIQAKSGVKGQKLANVGRTLRIDLTSGAFLPDGATLPEAKTPVRPWVGPMSRRGDEMKAYVPSLDPVRVAGVHAAGK